MVIKYVIIKLSDWLAKLQTYFIVMFRWTIQYVELYL